MSSAQLRIAFAGAFAITSLVGGLILEATVGHSPEWLTLAIGAAAGYVFGHAKENGLLGGKK